MSERHAVTIRRAIPADIPALLQLERAATGASHWSVAEYDRLFSPEPPARLVLIAEIGVPVGFLVARSVGPDWELENIGVAENARRSGVGTALLRELLLRADRAEAGSIFLEVRESNSVARALYEKLGFRPVTRRAAYYGDPSEDAVVYRFSRE